MKKAVGLLSLLWVVLSAVPGYAQDTQPLYMTTMTHMESNFQDDRDQKIFERHVRLLSYGMSLAEGYGAKLTVESEKSFARANTIWGVNFMQNDS
jgi:hypothetical protein